MGQSDGGQQQMEENLHGKGAYLWKQQVQTESFIYFTWGYEV